MTLEPPTHEDLNPVWRRTIAKPELQSSNSSGLDQSSRPGRFEYPTWINVRHTRPLSNTRVAPLGLRHYCSNRCSARRSIHSADGTDLSPYFCAHMPEPGWDSCCSCSSSNGLAAAGRRCRVHRRLHKVTPRYCTLIGVVVQSLIRDTHD